jgi:hypothetical protein
VAILLFSATFVLTPLLDPATEKMSSAFSVAGLLLWKLLAALLYLVLLVPRVSASVFWPIELIA